MLLKNIFCLIRKYFYNGKDAIMTFSVVVSKTD